MDQANLNSTIRVLDGVDHKIALGDIPLERVKITTAHLDCGCTISYIWDKQSPDLDRIHYPHHHLNKKCPAHAHATDVHHHFQMLTQQEK